MLASRPELQVFPQACSLFVPLVEAGWIERDNEATIAAARRYLQPLIDQRVDTVILGCTHFPLLIPILSDILGTGVTLIDSGEACASRCAAELEKSGELNRTKKAGECRFYVSDRPEDFIHVARMFLGREVREDIRQVELEFLASRD